VYVLARKFVNGIAGTGAELFVIHRIVSVKKELCSIFIAENRWMAVAQKKKKRRRNSFVPFGANTPIGRQVVMPRHEAPLSSRTGLPDGIFSN
jgi:hypothetical protein